MPLYEFVCPAGHKHEAIRSRDVEVEPCACGQAASRTAVNRIGFSGFASTPEGQVDFREDFRRYKEASDTHVYNKARLEDSAQRRFADPPVAQMAKAEARKLDAAGVKADQIKT